MTLTIPTNDPSWLRLSDSVRREAHTWCAILNAVHASENKAETIRQLSRPHRGFSRKTILRREWQAFGKPKLGWRACVDWAKASNKRRQPALFIEHWIKLNEGYQRDLSGKRAFDKLRQQFRRWAAGDHTAAVPGFYSPSGSGPECPRLGKNGLPPGCSYRRLMQVMRARQSRAEAVLARRGLAAARAHLPHVPQDVSQVRPLEYVVFDDVEVDFLITVQGSTTPVKLRLLVAMDLCSRVILGFGVRPALTRPDGVEDSLKLRDMKCIVARFLARWGYPLDYPCTFIVERATATLKEGDIAALHEISNGQIHVSLTSMIVGQVFEFRDRATGNSWGKAWLESFFNWLHNELGDRPGQKGRRYDLAPAELHGRTKELALLMKAGQRMPLALRQELRVPFMSGEEALQELNAAFAKANARTDHALQGHEEIQIWRLPEAGLEWKPREELPLLADRLGLEMAALSQRVEWDKRMESPNERFQSRLANVARAEVSPASLHRLMDEHRRVRFADFQFAFDYQGKEYIYLPGDALCVQLEHEAWYLAWFDPADLSVIYLTRDFPHRGWIGEVKLFRRTRRGELEEKKAALAKIKGTLSRVAGEVAGRHPEKFDTAIAHAEQNVETLRNVTALEIEVDVASTPAPARDPAHDLAPSDSPAVAAMTARIMDRARAKTDEKTDARRAQSAARFGEILREQTKSEGCGSLRPTSDQPEEVEKW